MKKHPAHPADAEKRIRAIADYYDNQTEAEAVAEDTAAWGDPKFTFVQVPVELVADVQKLIAQKKRQPSPASKVAESKAKYK